MFRLLFLLISFSVSHSVMAQYEMYAVAAISDSLNVNANLVVRIRTLDVTLSAQDQMSIYNKEIITVLNPLGAEALDLSEYYDKNRQIAKINVTILDQFGKEIKQFKRKDFKDVSVADGVSIFNDNRRMYLDYTPNHYPFTIVFETEVKTSNTAFIPSFSPIIGYFISTEKFVYSINCNPKLNLKVKEVATTSDVSITKQQKDGTLFFEISGCVAKKPEDLMPAFSDVFPRVYFGVEHFQLEKVNGSAKNWEEFGKWYYERLLADTEELPELTKSLIKERIGSEKDPIQIAKKVYQFVQEKTRYVSVQAGIGGWKPMLAAEVDRLGYGDCKALTNYTRSLLKTVGVDAHYTVVYAGSEKRDILNDLASIQGNHVILTLPNQNQPLWLECTSQTAPFSFQGDFTDSRDVLVIKPEGGQIMTTKNYSAQESLKTITGSYSLDTNGALSGKVKMVAHGIQYDNQLVKEFMNAQDRVLQYKEEFDNINNLTIKKIALENDKEQIAFREELELMATGYATPVNGDLMFAINAFDQNNFVPKKYKQRKYPFEVTRGYSDSSEITITIPEGFVWKAKPNPVNLETQFGSYSIDFIYPNDTTVVCKRKLLIKEGNYEKQLYENYRKFRELIAKSDNSKAIISKSN